MQLKKEPFGTGENRVDLYELSALQRVDYLAFLVSQESTRPSDDASALALTEYRVRQTVMTNAWLVSQSLWQADPSGDAGSLMRQVLQSWPPVALSEAAHQVLKVSDMLPPATDAQTNAGQVDNEEPVSLEKP